MSCSGQLKTQQINKCHKRIIATKKWRKVLKFVKITHQTHAFCVDQPVTVNSSQTHVLSSLYVDCLVDRGHIREGRRFVKGRRGGRLQWTEPHEVVDLVKTQCQDEFRNLSGCVIKILTAGKILQISIARCQIESEIHSFPTMYGKGGGRCGKNWRNRGFRPKIKPKTSFF